MSNFCDAHTEKHQAIARQAQGIEAEQTYVLDWEKPSAGPSFHHNPSCSL